MKKKIQAGLYFWKSRAPLLTALAFAFLCISVLPGFAHAQEIQSETQEEQTEEPEEMIGVLPAWMLDETLTVMDLHAKMSKSGEGLQDDEMSNIVWDQYELFEGMTGPIAFYYMQDKITGWSWKDEQTADQIELLDLLGAAYGVAQQKWDGLNAENYTNFWAYPLPEDAGTDCFLKLQETAVAGTHYLMLSYNPEESYAEYLKEE